MLSYYQQIQWTTLINEYLELTKPRIVLLLLFTTFTAMVVASDGHGFSLATGFFTLLGGAMSAGGASALNQYFDRAMDAQMSRTKNRPLPAGRIKPLNALLFGCGLLAWSVLILAMWVNVLTAILASIGAIYYLVIYTLMLKRNTALNIIIGGGAGAMPVLVGWSAVTGTLAPEAILLFAIIFFWTPPHSWALALLVNADYQRVNVPMLPAKHGTSIARLQIVWYSLLLVLLTLLPYPLGMLNIIYFIGACILGSSLLYHALQLLNRDTGKLARRMFRFSSYYLLLLFLLMILDRAMMN